MELTKIKEGRYSLGKNTNLQKTHLGEWRIVYPIFIDGKINWKNLLYGGRVSNILFLILAFSLITFITMSYARDTEECRYLLEHPPRCEILPSQQPQYPNYSAIVANLNSNKEDVHELNISISTSDNDTVN